MSLYDCRQIASYPTTLPLMRGSSTRPRPWRARTAFCRSPSAIVSLCRCAELSGRILVITDSDKAKADRLATEIGQEFISMRGRTAPDYLP